MRTKLLLVFMIASIVELFIGAPIAKKIAFALPYDKSKKLLVILILAFLMVSGMVLMTRLPKCHFCFSASTAACRSACSVCIRKFRERQ
ncbi:hypothetical protein [Paenibacillus curdlanolyticus]|uniref:hypothetical protein n=1 Tax=Paenibacillus curdlanolyticus TaxID=59840 RepID=UPI0002D741A7|nr:hypothetical protein [Paenibacillus curdlanolyticus]